MSQTQSKTDSDLEKAIRRANLLAAAAEASQNMTQILDIDELMPKTVDIICEAYNFYYAGVFLIDDIREFAVLRAGRGEPGRIMMENNHKLAVGGNSMIGACTARNEARISLDVDTEKVWYPNPVLPKTRSEMALPLTVAGTVIGAVTVQSVEEAAFSEEDIASLQAMANQLAIAIDNARQRRELEKTHAELLQAKTFEAIATATGDAIHWIGNKSEPIRSSVDRIREDARLLICMVSNLLQQDGVDDSVKSSPLAQLIVQEAQDIQSTTDIDSVVAKMSKLSPEKLHKRLSLESTLEDLEIIEEAATVILKIKEDLIGPAREQAPRPVMVDDVLNDAVNSLDIPADVISVKAEEGLPLVLADSIQLNRVFTNLIKNAYEAMEGQSAPRIKMYVSEDADEGGIVVKVKDNGSGIPEADMDKIWVIFHTTKGIKGHSGLGLPACRLILDQIGGDISVSSKSGHGATFRIKLPAYEAKEGAVEVGEDTILLIDDDDHWRSFAANALESAGYKVSVIGPNDAVKDYNQYDLIIVDDILTTKDSRDVLEAIKAGGVISKTVAVSSNLRVERTKERMLIGIHNLLPKPYTRIGLLSKVNQVLGEIDKK